MELVTRYICANPASIVFDYLNESTEQIKERKKEFHYDIYMFVRAYVLPTQIVYFDLNCIIPAFRYRNIPPIEAERDVLDEIERESDRTSARSVNLNKILGNRCRMLWVIENVSSSHPFLWKPSLVKLVDIV